ncbi:MAG: endopeptidase La [candidate division Zixibacteria bacterium]|nr:endopeptidase La [candidate division Zixibacteria bacterium]
MSSPEVQMAALLPPELPVLPLLSTVVFPQGVSTLQIGFEKNIKLFRQTGEGGLVVLAGTAVENFEEITGRDISKIGVAARVLRLSEPVSGSLEITLEGLARVNLVEIVQEEPFLAARVSVVFESDGTASQLQMLVEKVLDRAGRLLELDRRYPAEYLHIFNLNAKNPSRLADVAATILHIGIKRKLMVLETVSVRERLERLLKFVEEEIERLEAQAEVAKRVDVNLEKAQKESYLREQLREIKRQLGEEDPQEKEALRLRKTIQKSRLPKNVQSQLLFEVDRLRMLSTASAEYGATRAYIDWVLFLPWAETCEEPGTIEDVERELAARFYALQKQKEKLLEYLAVHRLKKKAKAEVLCFAGPPGTGRTSFGEALAKGLGREFVRVSLGGVEQVSEIVGERRQSLGAQPGKIIQSLSEAGVCNPVVLLEDIDKLGPAPGGRGDIARALLEVLDGVANRHFTDRYLGIPFDLSKVLFLTTADAPENISELLAETIDLVEFPGYVEEEKIEIARNFLVPRKLTEHGLSGTEMVITAAALEKIVRNYTSEAGLGGLEKQIEIICHKCARRRLAGENHWEITEANVEQFLGPPLFLPDVAEATPEVGVATGLAWTASGGDIMLIEALKMRGSGQVISTGSLGEVMKESIQAAHSYVRSKADMLGIDFDEFTNHDIHIHFPSGAVPKDGPSAGITVSLVIASVLANQPIKNDVAMTGEVSLRGKVLPVGGIKEKVSAAHRVGIKTVVMPKQNQKDLEEVPASVRRGMQFEFVEKVDEVFSVAFTNFKPKPQKKLEDLLKKELRKVKKAARQKRNGKKTRRRMAAKKRAVAARSFVRFC